MAVQTIDGTPGSPLLAYLAFNTLFVVFAAMDFSQLGFFRKYLEAHALSGANSSTNWINNMLRNNTTAAAPPKTS